MQEIMDQKKVIERQELENVILPTICHISVENTQIVKQEGRDYAVYPIKVSRTNPEGVMSGWMVLRRYSQFVTLHQSLLKRFPIIMESIELPSKLLTGFMKRKNAFLEIRRVSLEGYLKVFFVLKCSCSLKVKKFVNMKHFVVLCVLQR
jgi:hypothetical protein